MDRATSAATIMTFGPPEFRTLSKAIYKVASTRA